MRSALTFFFCLLARTASGQGNSAFADASPTPAPPVHPIVAQPALMPATITVQPITIDTILALPPEQLALVVQGASRSALLVILSEALAKPQVLATLMQSATAPTKTIILSAVASAPAQAIQFITAMSSGGMLAASLTDVKASTLYSLLQAASQSPTASVLLLKAIDSTGGISQVLAVIQDRMTKLEVSESIGVDFDILSAVSEFASQDVRYRDIGDYSAFGRQLFTVRQRVSQEGMTPENKAEIIRIYHDATEALKQFQKAERQ